ncbi:MAG: MFS transporter [Acidimicrobiia bacterium]
MTDAPTDTHRPGSVRAALAVRDFRLVWTGSFASNVGTWMQNVVLPVYVYARTGRASVVALLILAQLGPILFLAVPGGVLADRIERKRYLIWMQVIQGSCSAALAAGAALGAPIWMLFAAQLGVGIGNALNISAWSATLTSLVPQEALGGAVSLNSFVINGSRVAGPIIVAVLSAWGVTTAQFFAINALTYLFVIVALAAVHVPTFARDATPGWRRFTFAFRAARERPVVARIVLTLASFSLLSLPYVGLFPAVAQLNYGIDAAGPTYRWLYSVWGLGACLGGLAVATVFGRRDARTLIRGGFAGFALSMLAFAAARTPGPAFAAAFVLGACYFFTTTAMQTVLVGRLELEVRARVMALWFMSFGGTVPIGNLLFGPLVDRWGARWLLVMGAAWAAVLVWWCDVARLDRAAARG